MQYITTTITMKIISAALSLLACVHASPLPQVPAVPNASTTNASTDTTGLFGGEGIAQGILSIINGGLAAGGLGAAGSDPTGSATTAASGITGGILSIIKAAIA